MSQLCLDPSLDSPLLGKIKNDRTIMVFSFFSLMREKVTELPVYCPAREVRFRFARSYFRMIVSAPLVQMNGLGAALRSLR
jgi:hypothetical protein